MKRKYEKPNMVVIIMANRRQLLMNSERGIQGNSSVYNMRYGGIDDDGLDPE